MDQRLRDLERQAKIGDLRAAERYRAAQVRAGHKVRNPLIRPVPGDVVRAVVGCGARLSPVTRRVVACEAMRARAREIGLDLDRDLYHTSTPWALHYAFRTCLDDECDGRVHWLREDGRGARFGLVLRTSWCGWARGGTLVALGAL